METPDDNPFAAFGRSLRQFFGQFTEPKVVVIDPKLTQVSEPRSRSQRPSGEDSNAETTVTTALKLSHSRSSGSSTCSDDLNTAGAAMVAAGIPAPLPLSPMPSPQLRPHDDSGAIAEAQQMAEACRLLALQHETSLQVVTSSLRDADALVAEQSDAIDDVWAEKIADHVRRNAQLRIDVKQATRRAQAAETALAVAQARIAELEGALESTALDSSADIDIGVVGAPLVASPPAPSSAGGGRRGRDQRLRLTRSAAALGGGAAASSGPSPSGSPHAAVVTTPMAVVDETDQMEASLAAVHRVSGAEITANNNNEQRAPPQEHAAGNKGKAATAPPRATRRRSSSVFGRLARLASGKGSSSGKSVLTDSR